MGLREGVVSVSCRWDEGQHCQIEGLRYSQAGMRPGLHSPRVPLRALLLWYPKLPEVLLGRVLREHLPRIDSALVSVVGWTPLFLTTEGNTERKSHLTNTAQLVGVSWWLRLGGLAPVSALLTARRPRLWPHPVGAGKKWEEKGVLGIV